MPLWASRCCSLRLHKRGLRAMCWAPKCLRATKRTITWISNSSLSMMVKRLKLWTTCHIRCRPRWLEGISISTQQAHSMRLQLESSTRLTRMRTPLWKSLEASCLQDELWWTKWVAQESIMIILLQRTTSSSTLEEILSLSTLKKVRIVTLTKRLSRLLMKMASLLRKLRTHWSAMA